MLYAIPEQNIERLRNKIDKIQKKCAKYGCEFHYEEVSDYVETKTVHDVETGSDYTFTTKYINVEVEGVARIGNWSFAGVIDHLDHGNIINLVSDTFKAPERYLKCSPKCEHCNKIRSRKNTFLVYNEATEEYKQVGRTCLKDYTGLDAEICARMETFFDSIKKDEEVDIARFYSNTNFRYYDVVDVLLHAKHLVDRDGYKKSLYYEDLEWFPEYTSTKEDVFKWFGSKEWDEYTPCDEDVQYVEELINYFKQIDIRKTDDFLLKLNIICSEEFVASKHIGLLVSALPAYYRVLQDAKREEERSKQEALDSLSKFVGSVGDRVEVKCATFKTVYSFDTQYGTCWIYRFTDDDNNVYTWTSSNAIEDDEVIAIKGTIKEHKEYKGVKQTVLTRCRVS